jgi:hypothetical protein
MKIPLHIEVLDENIDCCDPSCPFLHYEHCCLFDDELEECDISPLVWQDDVAPWRVRCFECLTSF